MVSAFRLSGPLEMYNDNTTSKWHKRVLVFLSSVTGSNHNFEEVEQCMIVVLTIFLTGFILKFMHALLPTAVFPHETEVTMWLTTSISFNKNSLSELSTIFNR